MSDSRALLKAIHDFVVLEIQRVIAPWTRQGKLDLSTSNKVGILDAAHGGTGSTSPIPDPFVYLVDGDGAYLTDGDGNYLFEYL